MRSLITAGFLLLLAFTAFPQSASKILKQAEKAMGGAKALSSIRSEVRKGTINRAADGAKGRYLLQSSRPELLNISFDLDGIENEVGYNGRSGWYRTSRDGLATRTGRSSIALQARARFVNNLWFNYKADKSKIAFGGRAAIDGKPANVVILTTQKGIAIKLYFDPITGLLIRDELSGGDGTETTDYSDYRDVNGIKRPFSMRVSDKAGVHDIRLDEIKFNETIARADFDFPVISNEPLPDIPALLRDVQANEDKVEALLDNYSFTQKVIKRELGKDGVLRENGSETFQLSFYKGQRVSRLIEKDGRPLSEREQADADRDAARRVDEIEKQEAKEQKQASNGGTGGAPSRDDRRISIAEVLRASRLLNPRRERFRGREVIVFDFEPDPSFDMKNARSMMKFFGKTAGVIWVDEKDKQVARLEAYLFESFKIGGGVLAKLQKGASFTLEQERVGGEIWLPSQADINLSVRVLLVKGINVNQVVRSYNYRRFETEVKDATVGEPSTP
jgi:hypothetical protein